MELMQNILLIILAFLATLTTAASATVVGLPRCPTTCSYITILYPFGTKPGCYCDGFNLTCNQTQNPPKLLLGNGTLQVISISLLENIVCVKSKVLVVQGNQSGNMTVGILENGPYSVSQDRTFLTAIGCNILTKTSDLYKGTDMYSGSCSSLCDGPIGTIYVDSLCLGNGDGCCQTTVTPAREYFLTPARGHLGLNVEQEWFEGSIAMLQEKLDPFIDVPLKDIDSMAIPFIGVLAWQG